MIRKNLNKQRSMVYITTPSNTALLLSLRYDTFKSACARAVKVICLLPCHIEYGYYLCVRVCNTYFI